MVARSASCARVAWLAPVGSFILLFALAPTAQAERLRVRFDVNSAAECVDITPEEFAATNPHEKIVEAKFLISVFVDSGDAADLAEVIVFIENPERRLRVVDFLPKTELATDIAGHIEVVDTTEAAETADASLGGAVTVEYGMLKATASPSAGAGKQHRTTQKQTYQRLPPQELVLAAGTMNRQHGVFFKLRPSSQHVLEGMHELVCRFAVPKTWRGDYLVVRCEGRRAESSFLSREPLVCGHQCMYVGLYLRGDAWAKHLAQSLTLPDRPAEDADASGKSSSVRTKGNKHTTFKLPLVDAKWLNITSLFTHASHSPRRTPSDTDTVPPRIDQSGRVPEASHTTALAKTASNKPVDNTGSAADSGRDDDFDRDDDLDRSGGASQQVAEVQGMRRGRAAAALVRRTPATLEQRLVALARLSGHFSDAGSLPNVSPTPERKRALAD